MNSKCGSVYILDRRGRHGGKAAIDAQHACRLAVEGGWPVRAKLGTAFPVGYTGSDSCEVVVGRDGDAVWPPVIVEERPCADLVSPALTLPKHPGGQQGAATRSEEAARGSAEVAVDIWRSIEAASGL